MLSITPLPYKTQLKQFRINVEEALKLIPENYKSWRQYEREFENNLCSADDVFNNCASSLDSDPLMPLYVALLRLCDHEIEADEVGSIETIAKKNRNLKKEIQSEALAVLSNAEHEIKVEKLAERLLELSGWKPPNKHTPTNPAENNIAIQLVKYKNDIY
ncbi:hypothetical protein HK098_002624 [Nowakowskiella sp. JEL0407]|nr:hypothetical protein HK098_002624 [Nowakowskiella sp. JEL0407]